MSGRMFQITVSPGGAPKRPVATARVSVLGLEGDAGDHAGMSRTRHPGRSRVFARVPASGSIRQGDRVRLLTDAETAEVLAVARR